MHQCFSDYTRKTATTEKRRIPVYTTLTLSFWSQQLPWIGVTDCFENCVEFWMIWACPLCDSWVVGVEQLVGVSISCGCLSLARSLHQHQLLIVHAFDYCGGLWQLFGPISIPSQSLSTVLRFLTWSFKFAYNMAQVKQPNFINMRLFFVAKTITRCAK